MKKNVNVISEGVFEINERRKLFLNLRKKNSKILQYCNYLLLKEKEEKFKQSLLDNLKIYHKKIFFSPITPKKINTDRENYFIKDSFLEKSSFSNRNKNTKNIFFSNNNNNIIINKNLKLQKIRYNSANYRMTDKSNSLINNNNSFKNKNLILVPLGLKNYIKNKEIEDKSSKRKKFRKNIIFKNNNLYSNININLFKQKKNENDMTFPKKFIKLKKELTEETLKVKDRIIKFEDLIKNGK